MFSLYLSLIIFHVVLLIVETPIFNDEHPHQLVALKMCLDRTLPVSLFEKDKSQRSAVTINITGLGQEPIIVENTEQPEDVEAKYG